MYFIPFVVTIDYRFRRMEWAIYGHVCLHVLCMCVFSEYCLVHTDERADDGKEARQVKKRMRSESEELFYPSSLQ
jgi:hypothetical protein